MALFTYQALKHGKTIIGEITAEDRRMAAIQVRRNGLMPLMISEQQPDLVSALASRKNSRFSFFRKIRSKDITFFTRQLSTLLISGLPLSKALSFVADQTENPAFENLVVSIGESLQGGALLSEAMAKYPEYFNSLYLSMIIAGEKGGILDKTLDRLAFMREYREELGSKVKGALIYPGFMFLAMAGCIMVLMTIVVPRFAVMFADMGQALPVPTRILMHMSDVVKFMWWLIPVLAAAAIFALKKYMAGDKGRLNIALFKLKFPKIGFFLLIVSMARFCKTVGTLLKSGVSVLSALQLSVGVAGNYAVQKGIEKVAKDVRDGKELGKSMAASGIFPRYVCEMAAMGEESGTLDNMMMKVAENYEREIDHLVKALTSLLEPLMILVMGGVVAFIVMAMLLPVFQMNLMAG